MELEEIIKKHALKNAFDYGKANAGAVVGKVIAEYPAAKTEMSATIRIIGEIVAKVNRMKRDEIVAEMAQYVYTEKKKEKKGIELPDAEYGKVITRFAPEPNGYLHIGHAKAALLSYESARAYSGKMILRFDDTNPEKESQEYVNAAKDSLKWLGIEWAAETYTSDNIPRVYEAAEMLIAKQRAYVCTCDIETLRKLRGKGEACPCRNLDIDENLARWKKMLSGGYKKGEAVLRYRGDLNSLNTVMRDPTLARIMDAEHYRQGKKYRVWPSYDLSIVVMDAMEEITHPMRSKEYELRNELYYSLFDDLGWKRPKMIEFSRLSIKNAPISKRLLRPLVEEEKVSGWDDPRLPTLAALRRRGILPEAIRNFILSIGLSKTESEPGWELLLAENRKLLDPVSRHYFFVRSPMLLKIKGLRKNVKIALHPKKEFGFREIEIAESVYISGDDAKTLKKGEIFRLKDLCNVLVLKKGKREIEGEVTKDSIVPKKIQWVAAGDELLCSIIIPHDLLKDEKYDPNSLEIAEGYCEMGCNNLSVGDVVQFERVGFCRLDKKEKDRLLFVYSC
ncbi:MAG: glutamate--tRNA ligase [Candidatus Bilamarchaeaceae archaeon]